MHTRLLTAADLKQTEPLIKTQGSVFHSSEWVATLGPGVRRYGVFDDGGDLVGAFSLFEERRSGIPVVRNPPFTPVCGPVMRIQAQHGVKVLEARRRILDAMAGYLQSQRFKVVTVALDYQIQDTLPFLWRGFKVVPRYTYVIDLNQSVAEIVGAFSATRRNDISKARRDGLIVQDVSDPEIVARLVQKTLKRQRARPYVAEIDRILRGFARPENSYALAAYKGTTPIAALLVIHDQSTAYYLLGGYDAEDRHHGAGALILERAIQRAKEKGLKHFDFEGSTIPQIERFFRGFGGRLVPYFSVNRAWLPFEFALKFVVRSQF